MSEDRWLETIKLEAVCWRPYALAKAIEKNRRLTGGQGIQMIRQWQANLHIALEVYDFPKPAKLRHRDRRLPPLRHRDDSYSGTKQFQDVAYDQVEDRWATKMPSKTRMIQLYMSKQVPIGDVMPEEWVPTAKVFYVRALR